MKLRENSQRVVSDMIDGEMMLLNMEAGHYYSLQGTGAALWVALREGADSGVLLQALQSAFPQTPRARLQEDLSAFLRLLQEEELVILTSELSGLLPVFDMEYLPPRLEKYSDLQDLLLIDPIHDADEAGWPATPA